MAEIRAVLEDEGKLTRYGPNLALAARAIIDKLGEGVMGAVGGGALGGGVGGGAEDYAGVVFVPRIQVWSSLCTENHNECKLWVMFATCFLLTHSFCKVCEEGHW